VVGVATGGDRMSLVTGDDAGVDRGYDRAPSRNHNDGRGGGVARRPERRIAIVKQKRGRRLSMPLFRKKPVIIEAMELTRENFGEVKAWCGGTYWSKPPMRAVTGITIKTLEGEMNAGYGDWIIKGVSGEFYPIKSEIFLKTYDPVEE
jgi:hypothetical protein